MVAGEASGDQLAAPLIAALKARRSPTLFAGIGGPRMEAQGFESHYPMGKLSVRGYAEVLWHYREIIGIRARLIRSLLARVPVPLRSLVAFRRVTLQPGERRTLDFELGERTWSIVNPKGERVLEPGRFSVAVAVFRMSRQPTPVGYPNIL